LFYLAGRIVFSLSSSTFHSGIITGTKRFGNSNQAMRRHPRRHDHRSAPVQVISGGEDAPSLKITMLGAGQEVGRSCCVIEHRGKKVVCDAGLHPAYPGMGGLPFIDELDWSTVDAILVTQYV